MDYTEELKHVSLCAGYGGIDLGLARALGAVRTVAFVEIEAFAALNLVKKVEAGHLDECPIFTDLKAFPWELYCGRVDILSGGFPCQSFSSAGRRAGDRDPRHLWPYIADGIRRLGHPALVFLENVEGIISSKLTGSEWSDPEGTPVLLHVLRELERMGYEATAGVFSASEVGAPHQRKRVFILGCRSDLSSEGRGIVDRLLRGTERGQDVAHTCDHSGRCSGASVHSDRRAVDGRGESVPSERDAQDSHAQHASDAWPAPRGAEQHTWEPQRITKPSLGRNADGLASGMVYAELCESVDNRTDELRLLGNGVVPATAERAFRVLWELLAHASSEPAR